MTEIDIQAVFKQAMSAHQAGRLKEAEAGYRDVLKLHPDNADVLHLLGIIENRNGHHDLAVGLITRAVELMDLAGGTSANHVNAINNLGNALRDQGVPVAAITALRRAIELRPLYHEAHNNLGNAMKDLGRLEEAVACYEQALSIQPDYADALVNLGDARREQGHLDDAIQYSRRAITLEPGHASAHNNLAIMLLSKGAFSEGWQEYEWRWEGNQWQQRPFPYPTWAGEALENKTVLVYAEQGIGDEIMFASCLPDLLQQAGHVVVECTPRLVPLFSRSFPGATVCGGRGRDADLSWLSDLPAIDTKIAIGSLPMHMRPGLDSFPRHRGYLVPDEGQVQHWRERYSSLGDGLKVGLSWRGGRNRVDKSQRSIGLDQWQLLLQQSDVHFINLQYGDCASEIKTVYDNLNIKLHDWDDADPLQDLDTFAAQIKALDLVISIDNSTVHMAGALGIPIWALQSCSGDWRWLTGRKDSHWYPGLRQFWQSEPGAWEPVMQMAAAELGKVVLSK